jgi:hypothetical protein
MVVVTMRHRRTYRWEANPALDVRKLICENNYFCQLEIYPHHQIDAGGWGRGSVLAVLSSLVIKIMFYAAAGAMVEPQPEVKNNVEELLEQMEKLKVQNARLKQDIQV